MFDFNTGLPGILKVLYYPLTILSVLYIMFYIGVFFCIGVCEKMIAVIREEEHEAEFFMNVFMLLGVVITGTFWVAWFYEIQILVLLCTIFASIIAAFNYILTAWLLLHPSGLIVPFFKKLHHKIYERKHGKRK